MKPLSELLGVADTTEHNQTTTLESKDLRDVPVALQTL